MDDAPRQIVCKNCGSEAEVPSDSPPCVTPKGWYALMQANFGGQRVELRTQMYYFCSKTCLMLWIEKEVPEIPKAFRDAFK